MKIKLEEKSGGFLPPNMNPKPVIVDTDTPTPKISEEDIQYLNSLIQNSKFFELPSSLPTSSEHKGAADYKTYKITINDDKSSHSIIFSDISNIPNKAFSDLISFIRKQSD
jgi:hypothetical protein